ncbi:MAG: hypothetical protein ACI9FB_004174 [Candidatus Azotimanducaceae bacterium]|jgi:hypothetical protein
MTKKAFKSTFLSMLVLALFIPIVSNAASCSESKWKRAVKAGNSAVDEHNRAIDYFNDAREHCNDDIFGYFYPIGEFAERQFSELSSHQAQMNQATEHYENTRRLFGNAADQWYELYDSCDGDNSNSAYKFYIRSRDNKAKAAKQYHRANDCSSQLGKMKEAMLSAMPSLDD